MEKYAMHNVFFYKINMEKYAMHNVFFNKNTYACITYNYMNSYSLL